MEKHVNTEGALLFIVRNLHSATSNTPAAALIDAMSCLRNAYVTAIQIRRVAELNAQDLFLVPSVFFNVQGSYSSSKLMCNYILRGCGLI